MNSKTFRAWFFDILFWILATAFFLVVRYVGASEMDVPTYPDILYQATIPGVLIGTTLFWLGRLFHHNARRRHGFLYTVALRSVLYIAFFAVIIFINASIGNSWWFALDFTFSSMSLAVLIYLSVVSFIYHFVKEMDRKVGSASIYEFATGKYFTPQEEEKIFLFMDLNDSTTLAEKLGHLHYSQLIQECFADLDAPLQTHQGRVYQYAGDEVILFWPASAGHLPALFFRDFNNLLVQKGEGYRSRYGIIPSFKASINIGNVMVAEVGITKSEIAFHGDVLNTAARIQSLCKTLGIPLLASADYSNRVGNHEHVQFVHAGNFPLKGKEGVTSVYKVIFAN